MHPTEPVQGSDIHGHEVIAMMMAAPAPFTRDSLIAAIETRFGAAARFHTCSAEGMTAAELVSLLEAKGKFMPAANGFQVNPDRVCRH